MWTFVLCSIFFPAAFIACILIHCAYLARETANWVPTATTILERLDGGDSQDTYMLRYAYDGREYSVRSSLWLAPSLHGEVGSQVLVLVDPSNPTRYAKY